MKAFRANTLHMTTHRYINAAANAKGAHVLPLLACFR